jgi:endoglucanase
MSMFSVDSEEYEFLEELLITPSPTGFESAGQKVWLDYVRQFADSIDHDAYGSGSARLEVDADAPTIMLEAHCDEIGMMIQHITKEGFIFVNKLGGSDSTIARGKHVHIHSRNGIVAGVVGNTAIHLQDKKNGGGKQPSWKDIYIDIGARSREQALKMVQIGDPITYADDFEFLTDEILTGRALDNRIGGFIIAQAFKQLSERKDELDVNVMVLNSVQEEIGGYGARMMTYRHMPDAALVTDVTHATDTPGINQKEHGQVKLGEGPTLTHGAANHPKIVELLEQVSEEQDIPIQHEAVSVRTGTDTDSIFYQQTGVPSALISLPLRYMHSPIETASVSDIERVISLMSEGVLAMTNQPNWSVLG